MAGKPYWMWEPNFSKFQCDTVIVAVLIVYLTKCMPRFWCCLKNVYPLEIMFGAINLPNHPFTITSFVLCLVVSPNIPWAECNTIIVAVCGSILLVDVSVTAWVLQSMATDNSSLKSQGTLFVSTPNPNLESEENEEEKRTFPRRNEFLVYQQSW